MIMTITAIVTSPDRIPRIVNFTFRRHIIVLIVLELSLNSLAFRSKFYALISKFSNLSCRSIISFTFFSIIFVTSCTFF